jgi:hypothetical protein
LYTDGKDGLAVALLGNQQLVGKFGLFSAIVSA